MINFLVNLIKNRIFKISSEPKYIVLTDETHNTFKIPCIKSVINYLKLHKDMVYRFQEEGSFDLANRVVFGHLKFYDDGFVKYDGVNKDLSVVIDYIYVAIR